MKVVAAYTRISHEEMQKEKNGQNSNSISTQLSIINNYAKEAGLSACEQYIDDGFSGTVFNRPAFNKMINDVEDGKISCVLVKDLSRLGRDYLMTGYLVEKYFPKYNVRFIAINDGFDSDKEEDELLPFRNIFNDWYARDISKKIRSSKYAKAYSGKRINSVPPYGFITDLSNKDFKLLPDKKKVQIINDIFLYYSQGKSIKEILNYLMNNKVLTPRYAKIYNKTYLYEIPSEDLSLCKWSPKTIYDILDREEYIGNTVSLKRRRISYKNHRQVKNCKENMIFSKNSHESIVDMDLWEKALIRKNEHH